MFYVLQNESTAALRRVPILLTDAATGTTAQTGVASTQIFPYVNINGGAFAGGAGTVGEAGYGQYYYEMDPSEISTLGLAGIHVSAVGCRDYDAIAQIAALNVYSASGAGISAADVWNYVLSDTNTAEADLTFIRTTVDNTEATVNTIDSRTQTIESQTNNISYQVWSEDLAGGGNSPYAAGTAGTILYDLSLGGSGISAYDVWNFVLSDSNTAEADLVTAASGGAGLTAGDVWDFVITGFGSAGSAAEYVTQTNFTVGNIETYVSTQTPQDVWTYSGIEGRTITGGTATTVTNPVDVTTASMTGIAGTVWSNATRTITGGTITTVSDKTGYSLSGTQSFNLTGNITGNLSGSVGSVTDPVTVASASMTGIAGTVWNYVTRTLTSGGGGAGISAYDVWNYVLSDSNTAETDLVQAAAGSGLTAGDVWTYATRTITGGTVDTVSNGVTVTTNNDKSGYSLSGTQSFNLTGNITGNLSGSVGSVSGGVTVTTNNDKTGYALSPAGVSAVQSGLSTLTQAQVGTEVDSSLADVGLTSTVTGRIDATVSSRLASASYTAPPTTSAIAGTVWTYGTRTLTSGSGISAGDVWSYNISAITTSGSAGKQLNDAAVSGSVVTIVNGPYKLTSTAEGTDGRIDILQGSVQTINLNLVNGFGQPFNVTGYTLSVDVYDVASSLVESYTPTVNYDEGGNISFDIDTVVTNVIGTYSLVVSLTNGDVVQVGPLTILVRPL